MLSQQSLIIFYSVCGAIVALMVFRLWWKGRRATPVVPPVKPRTVPKPVVAKATAAKAAVARQEETAVARSVVSPAPVEPAVASPVVASAAPVSTQVTRATYTAGNYSTSDTTSTSLNSDGPHLLEPVGVVPRKSNLLPRVLPEDVPGIDDSDRVFGSWLNPAFAVLLPESEAKREDARKDLMSAGYYNPHAVENLAAVRYALMMLGLVLFGALLLLVPPQLEPWMMVGCILAPILGWALPALYIRGQARERKTEIERAMPDLLDMLNMCVGQGLTVPDSLQRVGRDFRPVFPALSQELAIVNEQAKIGSMQTALENFSQRIELPEVHSLTSLLIQTERMGTSISQALVTYSDTMRESQRQQADEKGNRATFQLLFPTVLCLMPAVYLFLLGPAVVELQKFFYGGGADSLNSGSQIVQRMNATRSRGQNPANTQRRAGFRPQ